MVLPVSELLLERLIEEDVPYGDLTTDLLGIGARRGRIVFTTREPTVLCATEEAAGILGKFGAEIRQLIPSRGMKLTIEVEDLDGALRAARSGFDIIQIDKMPCADLTNLVREIRDINPAVLVAAAGGITEANAAEYAATGAHILVLSSVFFGRPSDIGARILPL